MIYTIGFTQKNAETFFELLKKNRIDILIDIRLNNTSQLSGFAKYPDICFFLKEICDIDYIHDLSLAPSDTLLDSYKKKSITWDEYEIVFAQLMRDRDIESHIKDKYYGLRDKNLCLLCSEPTADKCHRRLVAEIFNKILSKDIINI